MSYGEDYEDDVQREADEKLTADFSLLGGYKAFMTRSQCNKWQEFAFEHKYCQKYKDVADECSYLESLVEAGNDSRFDRLLELNKRLRIMQPQVFRIAKQWCIDEGIEDAEEDE